MLQAEASRLEQAERRFRHDIWSVAPSDAVAESGVRMRWFGPVLASVFADLPEAGPLNLVQGATEPGAIEKGQLQAAVGWTQEWEVDFMVPVPSGRPRTELAESWLHWHGYEQRLVMRRYARSCVPPIHSATPGVEVLELPAEACETVAILAGQSLGLPMLAEILFIDLPCLENWRCYVAEVGEVPVATGSLMIDGEVATLGIDGTVSLARGYGCHRALLERRLTDAVVAGCRFVQAFTADEVEGRHSASTRSLRRAGFEEVEQIVVWQQPAWKWAAAREV